MRRKLQLIPHKARQGQAAPSRESFHKHMTESAQLSDRKQTLLEKSVCGQFEITRRTPDEAIPLSYEQEQVWLHAQLATNLPLYNEPGTIHYLGSLDVAALEKSFNEILRRHEAWRTCFEAVDGIPVQKVQASLRVSLPVLDLRGLPTELREFEALRIATEDARKPIDLTKAPLFRTTLMRLRDEEYRLYLTLSHIIFDGVAIYRVLLPELSMLYESFAAGRPSPLPELPIQYADYACWQRRNMTEETLANDLDYWKRELAGPLPESYLPVDRHRVGPQTFCGSIYPFKLSSRLNSTLLALSRSQGVTLFQVLLAGFAALLCRYSGEQIIPIGSLTAGRKLHETQGLLGYFVNTVVLRLDLSGDPTFRDLVKRVRNVALGALEHDNLPFEHLVRELRTTRDSSHNPLFQALFSLAPPLPELNPAWQVTQTDVDTGVSKYDLHLELDERADEILPRIHYSTDLFDRATIARMANHWMNLLEGAAGNPELRVSQLPLFSEHEKRELLVEWNATEADYPCDKSISQLFAEQCERTPDSVAVREGGQQLTFLQLHERSNRLAQYLRSLGAGRGVRVALCVERSIDMVVGLLGILKTGAAYVPLDPSYPPQRIGFMLQDSEAAIVIVHHKDTDKLPAHSARVVGLDSDWDGTSSERAHSPSTVPPSSGQGDDTAYVLYTSGSTGMPKGVRGTHRAAVNRFAWMWRSYPFQPGEVCCQKTNLGFVDSVWEIFGPLLAGVPNVIIPQETLSDPEELLKTLAGEGVTRIVLVPSLLRLLLEHAPNLGERVPRLKLWTSSGEVLPIDLAERFRAAFPQATLLNLYGSAEVAADVTCHEVTEADLRAESIPIGKPIANTQIYILDANWNPVPIGAQGMIYAGGDNLACGYWRRAELTAERFVENPIAPERSARLYRTGDVGRFKANGEIEYLGRIDSQVKLRGMRLELGEIEAMLRSHPAVWDAVVALSSDQQRLAAYVTVETGQAPAAGELRRFLRARLPEHMVPANYNRLEHWPLLPSGKVDREAVLHATAIPIEDCDRVTAPRTEVERKLAEVWQELLQLEQVGIDQNFFEVGGHSLLAMRVMARIRGLFEVELPVRSLFEEPTLAALAGAVERAQGLGPKAGAPVLQRWARPIPARIGMAQTAFPTSFAQQRLWFLDQLEPQTAAYNLARAFRVTGPLDLRTLTQAFQEMVRRHESLRTVFDSVDGQSRQIILPDLEVQIPLIDLSNTLESEREKAALEIASAEGKKPFDLTEGPLLRAVLVKLKTDQHVLILVMHHIITDGWSIAILFKELTQCYEAFAEGRRPELSALPVQYAEYAQWQREYLSGEVLANEVAYWKQRLAGAPTILDLPTDYRRPSSHSWHGATEELVLDSATLARLKAFAQEENGTLFMVCLAAFEAWIWRYTMQNSLLIGTPAAARSQVEIENLIGFFVNTLVFRGDFTGKMSFRELVRQVRGFALEAYAHQDVPFEKLVEELVRQRSVDITPLFQVMFTFQNMPKQILKLRGLEMEELPFETGIAKFDLTGEVYEDDEEHTLHWRFEYNKDLFRQETIRNMIEQFKNLLSGVLADPEGPLVEAALMSARERNHVIEQWNDTAAQATETASIAECFELQAARTPNSTAILFRDVKLSYQQINEQSNCLANHLINQGLRPGSLVGVSFERSPQMVIALLGVLKAGAAYVPLDSTYPQQWLQFVVDDAKLWGVVTDGATRNRLPAGVTNVIALDTDAELIGALSPNNPGLQTRDDRAYVLYTSGSTGTPKGVEGTHRAAMNRFAWMWRAYPFQAGEVCCQKTNLGFVDSVWEIFGPLLAGVPNVIIPHETLSDTEELLNLLSREHVTRIVLVPSLLRVLLEYAPKLEERVPELRLWSSSGEVLPTELVERFRASFPSARLLNLYGSAEVAADVTCHEVSDEDLRANSIPIGRPIANTQIYILDGKRQPVPIGVRGEIYAGGENLARGYWRRAELTAKRFVENLIAPERSARLYRTGDMGRYKANGEIEYLGRIDSQVKLRGMRLELGEIEAVLSGHPGVKDAMVALSSDQQRLAAYVTSESGQTPSAGELRRYLRARLPEHMVPASYSRLEHWPLLPSGKVDRRAVLDLGHAELVSESVFEAPHDTVEDQLLTIWKDTLNLDTISVTDDFFSIGGHSLASARLLARIQKTFGKKLVLRDVFEAPTIVEMARLIRGERTTTEMQGILPLQPNGSLPPFFWVRGGPLFLPLSRRLGPERPSFGLQLPSSVVAELPATYKLEDIASRLIQVMRTVRPRGPYYLGGLCVNGVLAYEIAQQLVAAGESVPLVVMLDSQNPTHYFDYSADGRTAFLYQKVKFHLRKLARVKRTEFRQYIRERVADLRFRRNLRRWQNSYRRGGRLPEDRLGAMDSLVHPAALEYKPRPYQGRVMFFHSTDWPKGESWKLHRGWPELVDGWMEMHTIDSGHEEMLHEANVAGISMPILSCLRDPDASDANDSQVDRDVVLVARSNAVFDVSLR